MQVGCMYVDRIRVRVHVCMTVCVCTMYIWLHTYILGAWAYIHSRCNHIYHIYSFCVYHVYMVAPRMYVCPCMYGCMYKVCMRVRVHVCVTVCTENATCPKCEKLRSFLAISRYTFELRCQFDLNLYRGI